MTSLVIISDTHDRVLPDLVTSHIKNADVILHAGDFTGMEY
jgi:predicted phosphodiesterase